MIITVKVKCTGHGSGYNRYPKEFSFTANAPADKSQWDEYFHDSLNNRVIREARHHTACNTISLEEVTVQEYDY